MTVTASYSAVPFMLTVVPRGRKNCTMRGSHLQGEDIGRLIAEKKTQMGNKKRAARRRREQAYQCKPRAVN